MIELHRSSATCESTQVWTQRGLCIGEEIEDRDRAVRSNGTSRFSSTVTMQLVMLLFAQISCRLFSCTSFRHFQTVTSMVAGMSPLKSFTGCVVLVEVVVERFGCSRTGPC